MKTLYITIISILSIFIHSYTYASELNELLQSSQKTISLKDNLLSGPGFVEMKKEIDKSMFLSVGEFHLNKETPEFVQALINALDKNRFNYFAVETGPYSADFLQNLLKSEMADLNARKFFKEIPKSIAFFDHVKEFELLKHFQTTASEQNRIWGLDQEFMFSARFLLRELQSIISNKKANQHVKQLIERAHKGFLRFKKENEYDQLFMSTMSTKEFKILKQILGTEYIGTAKIIVDELEGSRSIYRAYQEKRYYDNNAGRINMFKANFMRNYNLALKQTGNDPQVIVKMGLYHSGKGKSPVRHFDIGNFLSEFAISKGGQSFHLAIVSPQQIDGDKKQDLNKQYPAMLPFTQAAQKGKITYFDLLHVRKNLKKSIREALSKESMDLIHAYDAILVMPQFTPSEKF